MKTIILTNEDGRPYSAKLMTIGELMDLWILWKPSTPFFTWLDKLIDANIITQRESPSRDYIVMDFTQALPKKE